MLFGSRQEIGGAGQGGSEKAATPQPRASSRLGLEQQQQPRPLPLSLGPAQHSRLFLSLVGRRRSKEHNPRSPHHRTGGFVGEEAEVGVGSEASGDGAATIGRSLLSLSQRRARVAEEAAGVAYAPEEWHDCSEEDFSDLKTLQVLRFQGLDKSGNRIQRYLSYKIRSELSDGLFCILYMHTTMHKEDNNPGMFILRQMYEEMSLGYKEGLQVVYFLHPGLRSRLAITTLGRLLLSGECCTGKAIIGAQEPWGSYTISLSAAFISHKRFFRLDAIISLGRNLFPRAKKSRPGDKKGLE
ncbi:hypothetical protein KSP40_PGU020862 [Platanthera guangdongensis]|uniref:CRAL-TRIO domain-containing protein n=1 Tax=Platanthera guangdongensis TaxID=2320717 RepID=A0ABR2M2U3_9ASPA